MVNEIKLKMMKKKMAVGDFVGITMNKRAKNVMGMIARQSFEDQEKLLKKASKVK